MCESFKSFLAVKIFEIIQKPSARVTPHFSGFVYRPTVKDSKQHGDKVPLREELCWQSEAIHVCAEPNHMTPSSPCAGVGHELQMGMAL